jgi:hypothetical protein
LLLNFSFFPSIFGEISNFLPLVAPAPGSSMQSLGDKFHFRSFVHRLNEVNLRVARGFLRITLRIFCSYGRTIFESIMWLGGPSDGSKSPRKASASAPRRHHGPPPRHLPAISRVYDCKRTSAGLEKPLEASCTAEMYRHCLSQCSFNKVNKVNGTSPRNLCVAFCSWCHALGIVLFDLLLRCLSFVMKVSRRNAVPLFQP